MKKTFTNITSYLLILILLVSSLQLSIYKMECLITGNSKISLNDFEDCNTKSKNDCSVSETCCCFHQIDLNFNYNSSFSLKNNTLIPFIKVKSFTQHFKSVFSLTYFNFFTNLPPPSGYDLLKLIQVFRL